MKRVDVVVGSKMVVSMLLVVGLGVVVDKKQLKTEILLNHRSGLCY